MIIILGFQNTAYTYALSEMSSMLMWLLRVDKTTTFLSFTYLIFHYIIYASKTQKVGLLLAFNTPPPNPPSVMITAESLTKFNRNTLVTDQTSFKDLSVKTCLFTLSRICDCTCRNPGPLLVANWQHTAIE